MLEARTLLDGRTMLEISLQPGLRYRLRYGWPGEWRVSYDSGVRRAGSKASAYEFRSVEQLRYDFERDVEEAQAADRQRR
jgi:hypothetical protein